jgi:hypothetical protein
MDENDEFDEVEMMAWLDYGITNGYCSEVRCALDGIMVTKEEGEKLQTGEHTCLLMVRVWLVDPDETQH